MIQHRICLGVITGPQGVRGAVKIKSFTKDPKDLFAYGSLALEDGRLLRLKLLSILSNGAVVAQPEGVTTRTAAEVLKGTKLFIERDQLPEPPEDEYYYSDLEGLSVQTPEGKEIGEIVQVNSYGAGDFLEITMPDGQRLTLPFTKAAVVEVRLADGFVIIDPQFLLV